MKTKTAWKEKMLFTSEASGRTISMDAKSPLGNSSAPTPKELLAMAVSGCTAMDVVALLKKYKQPLESLEVDAEAEIKPGSQPAIFESIRLTFLLTGSIDAEKALEAVHLSQSKFCGVSAMVAKAVPIHYVVLLNGNEIGRGMAEFTS